MNTIDVHLDKMQNVVCEICESPFFDVVFVLKNVPGLMIGSTTDLIKEVPLYRCTHCQHVRGADLWILEKKVE